MPLPVLYNDGDVSMALRYALAHHTHYPMGDIPNPPAKCEPLCMLKPVHVGNKWVWVDGDPIMQLLNRVPVNSCHALDAGGTYCRGNMNYVYNPFVACVFTHKNNPQTVSPKKAVAKRYGHEIEFMVGDEKPAIIRPYHSAANVFMVETHEGPYAVLQRLYASVQEDHDPILQYMAMECERIGIGFGFTSSWNSYTGNYMVGLTPPVTLPFYPFDCYGDNDMECNDEQFELQFHAHESIKPVQLFNDLGELIGKSHMSRRNMRDCWECGGRFNADNEGIHYNGRPYCDDCSGWCSRCEESIPATDVAFFNNSSYCEDCLNEVSVECHNCSSRVSSEDSYTVDYLSYCESCYGDQFGHCESCEQDVERDELKDVHARIIGESRSSSYNSTETHCADCIAAEDSPILSCSSCGDYTLIRFPYIIGVSQGETWAPEEPDQFVCSSCDEPTKILGEYHSAQILFPTHETEVVPV